MMSTQGPLTTGNFQYRLDEECRNRIRQTVAQARLADQARRKPSPQPDRSLATWPGRLLHRFIVARRQLHHYLYQRRPHLLRQHR